MPVTIPKLVFSEPRHNLPGRKGIATAEDRFTIAFGRSYLAEITDIHARGGMTRVAVAREIPVNGYGIADLVAVAWQPMLRKFESVEDLIASKKVMTRAFECKLKDWRSALAQAVRYRYFAHQSIVVLPDAERYFALEFLDTFKKTKIGLWTFDPLENRIRVHHTPRATFPKSEKYLIRATQLVHKATRQALPIR